jgi:hypothetical protein
MDFNGWPEDDIIGTGFCWGSHTNFVFGGLHLGISLDRLISYWFSTANSESVNLLVDIFSDFLSKILSVGD